MVAAVAQIAGAVLVTVGVGLLAVPAGLIVAGGFCILFGIAAAYRGGE